MKTRTALLELFKGSHEWRSFFRSCCETSAFRMRSQAWQFCEELNDQGNQFEAEEVEDSLLGWPLVGGGMTLAAWFARTMRGADTTMHINKPVSRVVQDGPFRFTRNPGYLSLTMLYAGIAVLRNALWAIVLLPLVVYVIQREVIEREEGYLERTFGEEYLNYKARVRR